MKNRWYKILALSLVLALSLSALSSCLFTIGGTTSEEEIVDYMTEDEVKAMINGSMPSEVVIEDVNNYDITIENSGGGNLAAAAKGVLSAVSIKCGFNIRSYDIFGREVISQATSAGAGVIYKIDKTSGNAYIITNYHVVYADNATTANGISSNIKVCLYGMESEAYAIPATFIGGSLTQDLAVLKVTGNRILAESNATAVSVANSDEVSILDTAIAIGNPAAGGISATVGCINVDSEYVEISVSDAIGAVAMRLMRIDTAVNSGNSGGGLFNDKGELIGIVNAKIVSSNIDNIAYAIPSNAVVGIVENIIHYCDGKSAENPYKYSMGITMDNSELYTVYDTTTGKVHKREAVKVGAIDSSKIGASLFLVGDVIKSITVDGRTYEINRMFQVIDCMFRVYDSSTLVITVERAGTVIDVTVPVANMTLDKVQ